MPSPVVIFTVKTLLLVGISPICIPKFNVRQEPSYRPAKHVRTEALPLDEQPGGLMAEGPALEILSAPRSGAEDIRTGAEFLPTVGRGQRLPTAAA
jgi:hypothetical protein